MSMKNKEHRLMKSEFLSLSGMVFGVETAKDLGRRG